MNPPLNRIAQPPRAISLMLMAQMFLGGGGAQVGWLLFGFGSIFFWIFAWHADLSGWRFSEGKVSRVTGELLNCRDTNTAINEAEVYANEYHYKVGDASIGGVSYSYGDCAQDAVTVEYLTAQPEISRIAGMRRDVLGPWGLLGALLPGLGLLMIASGVRKGGLRVKLLRNGVPVAGHVTAQVPTGTEINGRKNYFLTVSFTARDGREQKVIVRSTRPEEFGKDLKSVVLHDPANSTRALPIASLPGEVSLDKAGAFVGRKTRAILILPLSSIALNALLLWLNL